MTCVVDQQIFRFPGRVETIPRRCDQSVQKPLPPRFFLASNQARARIGGHVGGPGKALQGNLDPNVLFANPEQVAAEAVRVLESFGTPHTDRDTSGPTHVFNLGHGISQHTPPENVKVLVDTVHAHSRLMRARA